MLEQTDAIRLIVDTCMRIKPEDDLLVVADDYARPLAIAQAVAACAKERGASVVLAVVPPRKIGGEEPRKTTAAAMRAADVVFGAGERATPIGGHSAVHEELMRKGVRQYATNGLSEDYLRKPFSENDILIMKDLSEKIASLYTQADTVKLSTPHGTDLTFSIKGRQGTAFHPIKGVLVPDYAESPVAPVEDSASGTVVFDGQMDGWGYKLSKPLVLKVVEGKVADISGNPEDVDRLKTIVSTDADAANLGEFAIGTSHTVSPVLSATRYDCAILGTVHIGLGRNTLLGGISRSRIHIDGIMTQPTVELDGRTVVDNGKVLV
ncbi:MAG: aminopeptidase [Chloroflexi bacterium]|nr:aminopeptidase [Chloroflexota bacterium]